MLSLPLQDVLLLLLVVGSMGLLFLGDLPDHLDRLRRPRSRAAAPPDAPQPAATAPVQFSPQGPAEPPPPPAPTAAPALPPAADLLLVDDSAVARAKLRRLFEGNGYTVQLARDGVEALALLAGGRFRMMVTDLEMPNMDGVTLVNTCLRQPATVGMPVIAVSAHENLRAKFNACRNICGVHRKPWVDDILLSHVATVIGAGQARAPAAVVEQA